MTPARERRINGASTAHERRMSDVDLGCGGAGPGAVASDHFPIGWQWGIMALWRRSAPPVWEDDEIS
jgi:hypothetical protein